MFTINGKGKTNGEAEMTFTRRQFAQRSAVVASAALLYTLKGEAFADASPPIIYDSDGLIVHENMDGGDTAQREGWYWLGVWIRQEVLKDPWPVPRERTFPEVLRLLEPNRDGIFHRHPKLAPWNNPFDQKFGFSRDQMVPLVAAMGVWDRTSELRRLWNALPQDEIGGTKHTFNGERVSLLGKKIYTGDIVGPATINLFRRAWREDPAIASDGNGPAGEIELTVNAGLKLPGDAIELAVNPGWKLVTKLAETLGVKVPGFELKVPPVLTDRDATGDDLNLIVLLLMSILRFPFQGSSLIPSTSQQMSFYAKNRLVSYGSFVEPYRRAYAVDVSSTPFTAEVRQRLDDGIASGWPTDASRVYGVVRWYHRKAAGANPKLAELYAPIVREYLE
jgi:hypothetical protein